MSCDVTGAKSLQLNQETHQASYASVCLTAGQRFRWDGEGERKRTADRELSSSDALATVFIDRVIDRAGSGGGGGQRQIRFGTSPSRLTRSGHAKPKQAATLL